jgi:hypothetical protein
MKFKKNSILIVILLITFFSCSGQDSHLDSLYLRVLNKSKYLLKSYSVKLDGKEYIFENVESNKYSDYMKLPYLWAINSSKTTVVNKRVSVTIIKSPIDHIGDKIYRNGKFTILVNTRKEHKKFKIEEILNQE